MNKIKPKDITRYSDAREKILSGLTKLSAPIVQTLTPKGRNVIFQDHGGLPNVTNDGFTIAQHLVLEDPIENIVTEIVKQSSFRTNSTAGDGTTTTVLLADTMIRQGFNLIDNGYNPMDLKRDLDRVSKLFVDEIPKYTHKITSKQDLEYVARVSSNNDVEISKNVSDVISEAKEDGMVFIEPNPNRSDTKIIKELGFMLNSGMFAPQLSNVEGRFVARYENVPVLITDKRLYYENEVITILQKAADTGYDKVVIIAADFIGQAPNILIANHLDPKVNMSILMVKCPDLKILDDLASYLGGQVYSEKRGSIVEQLEASDYMMVPKIYCDPQKTIISPPDKRPVSSDMRLRALRDSLKNENDDSSEYQHLKQRIASMTNGVVTIKVGARTQPEMNDKIYRYEDSVNATRNALIHGYVVGGGVTMHELFKNISKSKLATINPELRDALRRYCESSLRQISINCNKPFQQMLENTGKVVGYNALTDKFEDLLVAGIIEPSSVLKATIENSLSVAGIILSSDYIITIKQPKQNGKQENQD